MRNKILGLCLLLSLLGGILPLRADEGMWMPGRLDKPLCREMRARGLKLSPRQLYHPSRPALTDAVVSFGGFCSGVVVSEEGLVFTNHHCGFSCVQQHSTEVHNYLRDGFTARTRDEELPNPGLYVRFLVRQEEVTDRVRAALTPQMDAMQRGQAVDSVLYAIGEEVSLQDSTLTGVVDAYYDGGEYWLSVYRDFNDVRLVYAPPSSVGKFGWDTDNWQWPRHTGDFCVFRIYADRENRPADYSPDNIPYRPAYVAPISLNGYREGDFCMTLGYPGTTERYLSSYGIEERLAGRNQAQIDVRSSKQAIWKRAMEQSEAIRLKYASKYSESSNYWKNSIGMKRAVRKLHVLPRKCALEQEVRLWLRMHADEMANAQPLTEACTSGDWLRLFPDLELAYKQRSEANRAQAYFEESFLNAPELVQLSFSILNLDFGDGEEQVTAALKAIVEQYADLDLETDKEVFAAMIAEYRTQVDSLFLPELYRTIDTDYGGNGRAYVDTLYARSQLTTPRGLQRLLEQDTTFLFFDDPAVTLGIDLITKYFEMNLQMQQASAAVDRGERMLTAALRRMRRGESLYPDANSTMRLSYGTVCGYAPCDGTMYASHTTVRGILEKVRAHQGDPDFEVQPELLALLASGDFGRYADAGGEMNVCFLSDNDITGGNSGSAMFDARGRLLGLAFDGNWEAMSGDLLFEPALQRCIGVDVRYILFLMEHYGQAAHLVRELKLSR